MINSRIKLASSLEKVRTFERRRLGEILSHEGIITPQQLNEALLAQKVGDKGVPLGAILRKKGWVTDKQICDAISRCLEIPYVQLASFDLDTDQLKWIPPEFARQHSLIPVMMHREQLVVAMEDPTDTETLNMVHFLSGHVVEPVLSTAEDIDYAISQHYGMSDDKAVLQELPLEHYESPWSELQARKLAEDRPTVKLVQNLLLDAINHRASDIHIRPKQHSVDILFRVDGSLIKIRNIDKKVLPAVVARIKILGGMNIAEHRLPQDGRSKVEHRNSAIDLRISIMPTIHGESVVIRILDTDRSLKSIEEIGFFPEDAARFQQLVQKSSGLILVTGPTGSGKTTTLYAALQAIRSLDINIITVEDPVEYQIDDILQIQINPATGYTFARALRNILRHDPDSIMIGEIRDEETAKIAVESSLTGHLVLSTLHTNSAATTVTRLLEIGIQSYLLNATLLAVLAQRLVKKSCPHCLEPEKPSPVILQDLGVEPNEVFYKGKGCEHCHQTGYSGRIAVYELMVISPEIREMIKPGVSASEIEKSAVAAGMTPLSQNALAVARKKLTSLQEVYRVRLL